MQAGLLEYMPEYAPLYSALGIDALGEAQLLARFLLPAFGQLGSGLQERVTSRVLQQWPSWKRDDAFVAALADAPFVLAGRAHQHPCSALHGTMSTLCSMHVPLVCHARLCKWTFDDPVSAQAVHGANS